MGQLMTEPKKKKTQLPVNMYYPEPMGWTLVVNTSAPGIWYSARCPDK